MEPRWIKNAIYRAMEQGGEAFRTDVLSKAKGTSFENVLELTEYIRKNMDEIVKEVVELDFPGAITDSAKKAHANDVRRALTTFADDDLLTRVVARGAAKGKISATVMENIGIFFARDCEWRIVNRQGKNPAGFADLLNKTKDYVQKHAPQHTDEVGGKIRCVGLWFRRFF